MKVKVESEIEPREWLWLAAFMLVLALILKGQDGTAVKAVTEWMKGIR